MRTDEALSPPRYYRAQAGDFVILVGIRYQTPQSPRHLSPQFPCDYLPISVLTKERVSHERYP